MTKIIAVVGGKAPDTRSLDLAYEVGKLVAKRGAILVTGGLTGVMEAACRGAKEAGGLTIGILPGDSHESANPYVDIPIVTGMGEARNIVIVKTADALIAIDGKYGTLSEIAIAVSLGKPVVGLNTWDIPGVIKAATPDEAVDLVFKP